MLKDFITGVYCILIITPTMLIIRRKEKFTMTGMYVASNTTGLAAQFGLTRNIGALGETLNRLSTGLKINSGKDDPAGLIASELLKSQITGTNKAISNTQRANSLIATADSAMNSIGVLLNDIKGLVVESANTGTMTSEQLAANQLQVDAALDSIDRIARTTNYGGKKILDGSLAFRTSGVGAEISNLQINSANFGTQDVVDVKVNVTQAADYARLISNGTGVSVDTVLDIIGSRGSATVSLGADSTNDDIADAINRSTDSTGVLAYVEGKEQAGNVILSSTGANNDILISALNAGYDAGNYEFRITRGDTNSARIVTEAVGGQPGVVEISLVDAYENRFNDFAGLFDIIIDTTNRTDTSGANIADTASTSVNMTRGTANRVTYHESNSDASTNVINGRSMTAFIGDGSGDPGTVDATNSDLNGWSIVVDNRIATGSGNEVTDLDAKIVYVNTASDADAIGNALGIALGDSGAPAAVGDPEVVVRFNFGTTNPLQNGDRFTFANGASAGEVTITYTEGSTANDILAMLNAAPNVSASLVRGVDGDALIPMLPTGQTKMVNTGSSSNPNSVSRYASGATAQDVIDLINSNLGDYFRATGLNSDGGSGGRVNFMDASAVHGDINLGNAIRFTGMDNGPIVRLTNLGTNGQTIANQKLSVSILHPSESDILAGIQSPVLEIKLATDAQGQSITTAADLANFFSTLTAEQTMGVSVTQLFAPGVAPNDPRGAMNGIVQPTVGATGSGDIFLLGGNQTIVDDHAVARIAGNRPMTPTNAISGSSAVFTGTTVLEFENTSALNGVSFGFTRDEAKEGFDANTGTLIMFLDSRFTGDPDDDEDLDDALRSVIDGAIAANWESIRAYTGAVGDAVRLAAVPEADVLASTAVTDAVLSDTPNAIHGAGLTRIDSSFTTGAPISGDAAIGVGADDSVLNIVAKAAGTQMAGVKIHFVNDVESGLTEYDTAYDEAYTATSALPDIRVEFITSGDGSRELIVTANLGEDAASEINAEILARALNANETFRTHFEAQSRKLEVSAANVGEAGSVLFNTDITQAQGQTVGGYRIDSGNGVSTSSGVAMMGQADSNERLIIESEALGRDEFVQVNVMSGVLNTVDALGHASNFSLGQDMVATINGMRATTLGNNIGIDTSGLALSMDIANAPGTSNFTITGGGALFQLGPDVVSAQQIRVGITAMTTTSLGGRDGQLYLLKSGNDAALNSSDEGRKLADRIVNQAIESVATQRGRLGATQRGTLEPNIVALQDSLVAMTEANALYTNADFAVESANMSRLQLLLQTGMQTLAIANQMPQYAAQLVR